MIAHNRTFDTMDETLPDGIAVAGGGRHAVSGSTRAVPVLVSASGSPVVARGMAEATTRLRNGPSPRRQRDVLQRDVPQAEDGARALAMTIAMFDEGPTARTPGARTRTLEMSAMSDQGELGSARRLADNAAENALVAAMYASERTYLSLRQTDPERADVIADLAERLDEMEQLMTRDAALSAHARAWQMRAAESDASRHSVQEDQVMAFGIVARRRDDEHHADMREAQLALVEAARSVEAGHPDCVRAQTAEFFLDEASLDAQFCRREMARALEAGVPGQVRAMVMALAMATRKFKDAKERMEVAFPD